MEKLQISNQAEELTHKPVQMGDSDNFSTDIVIQSIHSIGVDETISNPDASLHTIFYFATNLFTIKTCNSEKNTMYVIKTTKGGRDHPFYSVYEIINCTFPLV